jgi:hypothetical protein
MEKELQAIRHCGSSRQYDMEYSPKCSQNVYVESVQ